jgi:hypothetical protein
MALWNFNYGSFFVLCPTILFLVPHTYWISLSLLIISKISCKNYTTQVFWWGSVKAEYRRDGKRRKGGGKQKKVRKR